MDQQVGREMILSAKEARRLEHLMGSHKAWANRQEYPAEGKHDCLHLHVYTACRVNAPISTWTGNCLICEIAPRSISVSFSWNKEQSDTPINHLIQSIKASRLDPALGTEPVGFREYDQASKIQTAELPVERHCRLPKGLGL